MFTCDRELTFIEKLPYDSAGRSDCDRYLNTLHSYITSRLLLSLYKLGELVLGYYFLSNTFVYAMSDDGIRALFEISKIQASRRIIWKSY